MKFLNCLFLFCLIGCASVEQPVAINSPDLSFSGSLASGDVSGDRSAQVLSEIEAKLFQIFPRVNLLPNKSKRADVYLDLTVYSARTIDTRSSQELRNCRRWSEPDKDAKGSLQRLISRKCLDWQVQTTPCLNRKYELDVRIRARQRADDRVIVSDRKVFEDSDRQCGDKTPAVAALQAQAEANAASWVTSLLRAPLASVTSNQIAQPAMNTSVSLQTVSPQLQSTGAAQQTSKVMKAHALVIGNGAYAGSARLPNPTNDAKSMSDKLRSLGFDVTETLDADRLQLVTALSQFSKKAADADITLLFYAGHGVQITGTNYMLPVDLNLNDLTQAPLQGISLNDVVDKYLPGKIKLVFLDACRDNPLMQVASRGVSRGLAPINVSEGTLISYATKDGQTAADGVGSKNSPFTQALLEHLNDPQDIAVVLRKVRERVMKITGGKQQPWEYGSLTGGELVLSAIKPK